jgi:hypothetical protein
MKGNKILKGQAVPKHRRRKGKESESKIDSAACNQTLKQQKQLHDRNQNIPSILTANVNRLISPSKDTIWQAGLIKKIQQFVAYRRLVSLIETSTGLG